MRMNDMYKLAGC